MRLRDLITALILSVTLVPTASAAKPDGADSKTFYEFLSRDTIGAAAWTKANPTWDGRGVVIAILDTGVDVSVPGLTSLPQGGVKMLDARDFTGQGDIALTKAEIGTEAGKATLRGTTKKAGAIVLTGHDTLSAKPADGVYWIGGFDEKRLKNSAVSDINGDGDSSDRFGVVAFVPAGKKEPMFAIDLDGDGEIGDETLRPSYKVDRKHFRFKNADPRKNQPPVVVTGTVLFEDTKKVELHFDDGGHGTHCAGIAAGHAIQGKKGFDGIAPGAWVISAKIGDNTNAGGATTPGSKKRAIAYASKWARENNVPVVISMSYGVGSEIEGSSDIDGVFTKALDDNPLLVGSVAAGNEGPGISTVGTPGASPRVFTSGALLTKENAEALWGGKVDGHRIFGFSSRGGELNKPDAVSPGVAWSTVPPFLRRSIMAGTSMATPQSSGALALLISGALAKKVAWNGNTLKQAIRATAKPVKGYSPVDVGAGLIHVPSAWTALQKIGRKADRTQLLAGWDIRTSTAHKPGSEGATASYWRVGTYVPEYPEQVTFSIKAAYYKRASDKAKKEFFEKLSVSSDVSWLRADRSSFGVRGHSATRINARINPSGVSKPGVHVGRLRVKSSVSGVEEFVLPVVVVTPHTFRTPQTRKRAFAGKLPAGGIARMFVEVPAGATAMNLDFGVPKGKFGYNFLEIHDPDGRQVGWGRAQSKTDSRMKKTISGKDLRPGVWEVVAYSTFRNQETSHWELAVNFMAVEVPAKAHYSLSAGKGPSASVHVTNRFGTPFVGSASATMIGVGKHKTLKLKTHHTKIPFTIGPHEKAVDFHFELTGADYNRFTDIAIMALDGSGKAVVKSGFGNRFAHVRVRGSGSYTLQIVGATAKGRDEKPKWTLKVHQVQLLKRAVSLGVGHDAEPLALYPGVKTALTLSASKPFGEAPKGWHHMAKLTLTARKGGAVWYSTLLDLHKK